MSELGEATQVVEISFRMFDQSLMLLFKTTELGVKLVKYLIEHSKEVSRKNLHGEVSMEKMTRFEGHNLSTARFEDTDMDALRDILDQYSVPYVVMPESEVNGINYKNIVFSDQYRDRINAIIQHLGGNGEIVTDKTIPKYIESGEVSLQLLMTQNGSSLMAYQFPEEIKDEIFHMLNAGGIKYAVLPDLNLNDGMCEIAYSAQQNNIMATLISRYKNSCLKTMSEYVQNADPDVLNKVQDPVEVRNWVTELTEKVFEEMEKRGIDLKKPIPRISYGDEASGYVKEVSAIDEIVDEALSPTVDKGTLSMQELLEARKKIIYEVEKKNKLMMETAKAISV